LRSLFGPRFSYPGSSTGAERARFPEGNPDDLPPLDDPSGYSYPVRLRTLKYKAINPDPGFRSCRASLSAGGG
jgi:hypothetical protein